MPLIGLQDPTHKERASDAPGRYPRWFDVDEVLRQAESANPKWSPWPYELIASTVANHQERGSRLSVTTICGGCMRGTLIERKCDYIGSLDQNYASLRGSMIHKTLEQGQRANSIAEWRFYTTVNGQEISGSPDLITFDTIWDYKTTENPPAYDYMYNSHKLQLNFNRFCFNNATKWEDPDGVFDRSDIPLDPFQTRINHLAIVYLGPKGPKVIETTKSITVNTGSTTRRVRVPEVWTDQEVMNELQPRMEAWELAWNSFPTWPTGLENYPGWEGPPEFRCSGAPVCNLPNCVAKRYPDGLVWPSK